jgi:D-alanine transaminase
LRGVTRTTLLDIVVAENLRFEERPFGRQEAYGAREAFLSSATTIATPVVAIDGRTIGDGRPGPVTTVLRRKFSAAAARS